MLAGCKGIRVLMRFPDQNLKRQTLKLKALSLSSSFETRNYTSMHSSEKHVNVVIDFDKFDEIQSEFEVPSGLLLS